MKKVIIISILVVVVLGGGAFWYLSRPVVNEDGTVTESAFKSFFSFGNKAPVTTSTDTSAGGEVIPNDTGVIDGSQSDSNAKLKQVTDFAVAGVVTFMDTRPIVETEAKATDPLLVEEGAGGGDLKEAGGGDPKAKTKTTTKPVIELPKVEVVPALRFVARANGHIYEQYLDTLASAKISNTTIPTIYEALFAKEGQFVMYRYIAEENDRIQSFTGMLGGEESGTFLPEDIASITMAPSGSSFFYLAPLGNDIAGYVGSFVNDKRTQIFTSAFTEWLPQWGNKDTIFLTTKPSASFAGSVYALNKTTGGFTKMFGGVPGLTTLVSNASSQILYSEARNGQATLGLYSTTVHNTTPLNINTVTDKCVWASDGITVYCGVPNSMQSGEYPDIWYQGLVSFNDSIVKINTLTRSSEIVMDLSDIANIDAVNLTLSPDEKTLFIINKKDSTLWSLGL